MDVLRECQVNTSRLVKASWYLVLEVGDYIFIDSFGLKFWQLIFLVMLMVMAGAILRE